jgi:hypothetical protein
MGADAYPATERSGGQPADSFSRRKQALRRCRWAGVGPEAVMMCRNSHITKNLQIRTAIKMILNCRLQKTGHRTSMQCLIV